MINQLISKNGGGKKGITSLEKHVNNTRNRVALKSTEGKVAHLGWHSCDLALAI